MWLTETTSIAQLGTSSGEYAIPQRSFNRVSRELLSTVVRTERKILNCFVAYTGAFSGERFLKSLAQLVLSHFSWFFRQSGLIVYFTLQCTNIFCMFSNCICNCKVNINIKACDRLLAHNKRYYIHPYLQK